LRLVGQRLGTRTPTDVLLDGGDLWITNAHRLGNPSPAVLTADGVPLRRWLGRAVQACPFTVALGAEAEP
jgi:hypothetical protein